MVSRAMVLRCPNCGSRGIFASWFRLVPACPRCDLRFERDEGFFLGAFVMNVAITEGALAVFLVVAFVLTAPDPPTVLLATLGGVLMVVVPLVFYPFSKTLWTAVELVMRPWRSSPYP